MLHAGAFGMGKPFADSLGSNREPCEMAKFDVQAFCVAVLFAPAIPWANWVFWCCPIPGKAIKDSMKALLSE